MLMTLLVLLHTGIMLGNNNLSKLEAQPFLPSTRYDKTAQQEIFG